MSVSQASILFFFFNDTATTEIYTLSLHDALPIYKGIIRSEFVPANPTTAALWSSFLQERSEEHTSELQSPDHLVCRLLLEKKNHPMKLRPDIATTNTECFVCPAAPARHRPTRLAS